MVNKSQVSIEYVVIVAIGILIAGMLWIYANINISANKWDVQVAYAKNSVNLVVEAADGVYIQGPPARVYIYPNFPDNVRGIDISGNMVTMQLLWENGMLRNVSALSVANITGNISTAPGTHKILVQAVNNYVRVEDS
jgi:hypothetical protein